MSRPPNARQRAIRAFFADRSVPVDQVQIPVVARAGVRLLVQREYLLHPEVSGNKWRKLKYNLLAAAGAGADTLVTVGGAYSNHLSAVAAAGARFDFRTVGWVRGEPVQPLNPTLRYCLDRGMQLRYRSRADFRRLRSEPAYRASCLAEVSGRVYYLPEGGTNAAAVRGCAELWEQWEGKLLPDVATVCAGTGGTAAGLITGAPPGVRVEAYAALRGDFLTTDIAHYLAAEESTPWKLVRDYHFGGYAKTTPALLDWMRAFRQETGIPLDPVYTGKLFYGLLDRIERGVYPKGTTILAVHTGGLQGIQGFEERTGERL